MSDYFYSNQTGLCPRGLNAGDISGRIEGFRAESGFYLFRIRLFQVVMIVARAPSSSEKSLV
jgi:hypothetical protein